MAKITAYPPADALDGTETLAVVQDGQTRKMQPSQLVGFLLAQPEFLAGLQGLGFTGGGSGGSSGLTDITIDGQQITVGGQILYL